MYLLQIRAIDGVIGWEQQNHQRKHLSIVQKSFCDRQDKNVVFNRIHKRNEKNHSKKETMILEDSIMLIWMKLKVTSKEN